jgi:hypothetical protein
MTDIWLKIKIWVKGIVLGLVLLYVLIFLLKNTGQEAVKLWFWWNTSLTISPLLLAFSTFLLGIIAAILGRTTWTTVRQIKDMRERSRIQKMERENADMKAKAAMLQTKAPFASSTTPPPSSPSSPSEPT